MKRSLAPAFSSKALSEQEPSIQHSVDRFVEKIGSLGGSSKGINLTVWYGMVAFDILGEMAFGESFGSMQHGQPHFWQLLISKHLFLITLIDNLRRYSYARWFIRFILPKYTSSTRKKHLNYSRQRVADRVTNRSARKDFLTKVIEKVDSGEINKEELTAHASTLVIAGGETVATFLAATTFYLCKFPEFQRKLQQELHANFKSYGDISATAALQLPYLQAVINEGLRIYPPGSQGFPRISPGAIVDGKWVPPGVEVYTSAWSVTHDERNFHLPHNFIPSRWLDSSCTDVKHASQPFSLGPRGCLGRNFANVEISLMLAKLFYTYSLELVDNRLDWEGQSRLHVMWWKPDLNVKIIKQATESL